MKKVFTLYLDESGDNLIYDIDKWTSKRETHCTLLGTIVPHIDKSRLTKELNIIKNNIFKTKEVVLHSVDIRFKRGAFVVFHYEPELYEEFKASMNTLTNDLRPQIICSSLNKKKWVEQYPRKIYFKDDPYEQAFEYLLERYAHFLNGQGGDEVVGKIIVEDRGNQETNGRLQARYNATRKHGTQYLEKELFDKLYRKLDFKPKHFNIPGLQLSDYFAYPFYINHKFPERDNGHYDFLEQFIYPGDRKNYGHKKWPI